jgi:hypothetical protein
MKIDVDDVTMLGCMYVCVCGCGCVVLLWAISQVTEQYRKYMVVALLMDSAAILH